MFDLHLHKLRQKYINHWIEHRNKRAYECKMCERACAWWLQKIAGWPSPIWNLDDLQTYLYYYKQTKSTDAFLCKNHSHYQNVPHESYGENIQKHLVSDDTFFHYTHMTVPVVPRDLDRFSRRVRVTCSNWMLTRLLDVYYNVCTRGGFHERF